MIPTRPKFRFNNLPIKKVITHAVLKESEIESLFTYLNAAILFYVKQSCTCLVSERVYFFDLKFFKQTNKHFVVIIFSIDEILKKDRRKYLSA